MALKVWILEMELFEYSSVKGFEQINCFAVMITSILIDHSKLQQVGEYRLLLNDITFSSATRRTKIGLLKSLKRSLEVAVHRENKKAEWQAIVPEQLKEVEGTAIVKGQQNRTQNRLSLGMTMHRIVIHKLCSQFQLRDHLSIYLSRLQQQLTRLGSKFQRQWKEKDLQSLARTTSDMREMHRKLRQAGEALLKMRQSVVLEYQILVDNIKLLKVKNIILKRQVPRQQMPQARLKVQGKEKGHRLPCELLEMGDQNRNQILVNL